MAGFSIVLMIMVFWLFFAVIGMIIGVCEYVFESVALMDMSKEKGYPLPGTAWIPIYQRYILGKLGGNTAVGIAALVTQCVGIVGSIVRLAFNGNLNTLIFWVSSLANLASFVMVMVLSYNIFAKTKKQYAVVFTVLSVLTGGFLRPIFLFAVRKDIAKVEEKETIIQE